MATSSLTHTYEPLEPQSTLVHSRNLSTVSSVTLHTNTTFHSQPYEPLLQPIASAPREHHDVISHQSRHSDRILSLPRWSQSNVMTSPSIHDEKVLYTERKPRGGARLLRWSKNVLQTIMAIWAIYSTARYFLAFTIYQSASGQSLSLALGISTGLSFAFASCAGILYIAQTNLLFHGFSVQALLSLRSILHYLSSCCLFGPSLVNFVVILVWRKTSDIELQTRHRCGLDVDLVWSTRYSLCNHKNRTWGFWITLSIVRLLVTLIIIIAFHRVTSSSHFIPVPRFSKPRHLKGKKSHARLDSCQVPLIPGRSNDSVAVPHLHRDPTLPHQSSESTLSSASSPRNRLRQNRSRSSEEGGQAPSYNNPNFIPMNNDHNNSDHGYIDRFRSLVNLISRETEEALAFARSDDASSRHASDSPPPGTSNGSPDLGTNHAHHHQLYDYDEEDDFYAAPLASNDYHRPYPADDHIQMLNGYVRRMPTIESMGSREWRSSLASSHNTNRDRERPTTSRPPTRNARVSWAETEFSGNSEPRSRTNSLTARAELLVGMSGKTHPTEIGELMRRGETVRIVDSQALANIDGPETQEDGYASTTSGSKGTAYHTASMGSTADSQKAAFADATPSALPASEHADQVKDSESKTVDS
ncbi:hypothetical protein GALMADRAFT_139952 [Galerina marginata CBS 339.88]|uniref:Uncharacterized protein n=1 Tax=Galerina marginata (strain CBS 339.88) TaxID=685588 RepID=A0A067TB46_GALM3|nr:hypothetical protein GALMADRAFT_139952 [Galerina marginata CBS 339.88]